MDQTAINFPQIIDLLKSVFIGWSILTVAIFICFYINGIVYSRKRKQHKLKEQDKEKS